MFETTALPEDIDIFAMSKRPFKIQNITGQQTFHPINTRLPVINALYQSKKSTLESYHGCVITTPSETDVSASDPNTIFSDNFHRDFSKLSLSSPIGNFPLIENPVIENDSRPHYHCDVPTTYMRYQPKLNYEDSINPVLSHPTPNCDMCKKQTEFPFYSSLKHTICSDCYSNGNLPIGTSTFDYQKMIKNEMKDGNWTLEETNQMLTLFEELGDEWQEISARMKTKTPQDCLLHFLRLPIIDQYYIDDPISVKEMSVPDNNAMLPFLMAPDAMAAYVEFVYIFNHKLGSVVAEESKNIVENLLKANSSSIIITMIPDFLNRLIKVTQTEAGKLAKEESIAALETLKMISRRLENDVNEQLRSLERTIAQIYSKGKLFEEDIQ